MDRIDSRCSKKYVRAGRCAGALFAITLESNESFESVPPSLFSLQWRNRVDKGRLLVAKFLLFYYYATIIPFVWKGARRPLD